MYNNTLAKSVYERLGLPVQKVYGIEWFVNQFCGKEINYYNETEEKLVEYIDSRDDALQIYQVLKYRIIDKALRSIDNVNLSGAYFAYKNDIVFLEKKYLETDNYQMVLR